MYRHGLKDRPARQSTLWALPVRENLILLGGTL